MTQTTDTIVLVHGLWMTPLAWEHWVPRYQARGFRVLTPGYPGIGQGEEGVAALRADSSPIARVGVRDVVDAVAELVSGLDTPPIIMGHSFGGTFAQLLIGAGLGSAGVSIDGAAVKGIRAMPLSEIRSVLPVLDNPANRHRAVALDEDQFHYAFTNTLGAGDSSAAYERYAVPTPAGILFEGGFANVTPHAATTFDFSDADRAPLLFISGGSDHILPPVVQDANYKRAAKHSAAISAHVTFPGRDHYTCGEAGWEDVADFALDWALDPVPGELAPSRFAGTQTGEG